MAAAIALPAPADPAAARWLRRSLWLVGGTCAYNAAEAVVALWAGLAAESIALCGFGLDSVIECAAAAVVLWRLAVQARGAEACRVARLERRVHRFVGLTFLLLAAYVAIQGGWALWRGAHPDESVAGIVLAGASLIVMPLVAWGKIRAAQAVGSAALAAEAKETLACAWLSLTLLIGLAAHATLGWWWADPAAALAMVPWLIKEGRAGLRGEACC